MENLAIILAIAALAGSNLALIIGFIQLKEEVRDNTIFRKALIETAHEWIKDKREGEEDSL